MFIIRAEDVCVGGGGGGGDVAQERPAARCY